MKIGSAKFIIYLVALTVGLVGALWLRSRAPTGPEGEAPEAGPETPGFWRPARDTGERTGMTAEQIEAMARLEGIGYVGGSQEAPEFGGITQYDPTKAYHGLNLYISGHGPEAILMEMNGAVVHRWRRTFDQVWPNYSGPAGASIRDREFFSRVHLYPNGDLLAIFEGYGIFRLDREANLLWENANGAHHDLFVTPEGMIYVLTRRAGLIERLLPGPILEDFVTVLDAEGKHVRTVSILQAYERSPFAPMLNVAQPGGDMLHTNTIQVLDGRFADRSPAFAAGNVLVSCREIDTVAVIDMETEKVVWSITGLWHRQHQPDFLENGDMIIFDNMGSAFRHLHPHGRSKIIEFDPLTLGVKWVYAGTADSPFQSDTAGTVQRLPNGNTLIAESESGRAFEVTREKEIVWEYLNPERAGENNEFIAAMFDIKRLTPDFPIDWLD